MPDQNEVDPDHIVKKSSTTATDRVMWQMWIMGIKDIKTTSRGEGTLI